MSGHLSAQQIRGYRQGNLAAAEVLAVGDHLAMCAACRNELSSGDHLRRAFVALSTDLPAAADPEPRHLAPELLAAYVDEQADEVSRAIANRHLARCADCQTEISDLRRLKIMLTDVPARSEAPSPPTPLRTRIAALRRLPVPWAAVQAAAIVLLIVWAAMIPLKRRVAELAGQVSDLRERNQSLEQKLASLNEPQDHTAEPGNVSGESPNVSAPSITLNDGGALVTLDAQGRLAGLKPLPRTYEELIKTALTEERVKTPPLIAELAGRKGVLMGGAPSGERFSLLSPLGMTVETDRPTFAWRALSGA